MVLETFRHYFAQFAPQLPLENLELQFNESWGANNSLTGRQELQDALEKRLVANSGLGCSSISHSSDLGGFALWPHENGRIGFDIEQSTRVSTKIIERVKAPQETWVAQATEAALFWTAKEATFKSLRGLKQPAVLSGVGLEVVQKMSHILIFRAFLADSSHRDVELLQGLGVALQKADHCFALFCLLTLAEPST
jgi:hypothetical protein